MGEIMNILQLTTYPLIEPIHGGQIRSKAIQEHLKANGHHVISIAIYDPSSRLTPNEHDIVFDPSSVYYDISRPIFLDYLTGQYAVNNESIYQALSRHIKYNKIDVIFLEQPWLYLIAKRLVDKFNLKLVYSSHNIEYKLKLSMLKGSEISDIKNKDAIVAIQRLETDVVINSDLVIACTATDQQYFQNILTENNLKTQVVLAGNGVQPFSVSEDKLKFWSEVFKVPYPIFVGSAHKPNSSGFWQMMSPGLTFLRPDEEVVILGGVCDIILNDEIYHNFEELNKSRLHLLGKRDLSDLQAIVLQSHLVILPICEGEGSNLKTAEALESGKPIVATSKAFRGYEEAMNLPHVYIEDNPMAFREKVRQLLDSPKVSNATPTAIKKQFYWESQLKDIKQAIWSLWR